METKKLQFVNMSTNKDPEYVDEGSSGIDLRAWITEENGGDYNVLTDEYEITIKPLQRVMIHTGLYFDIPSNTEIQVRPRSGLAIKQGLTLINSIGTVDENYTGECCVLLVNLSNENIQVMNGDRIAQAVLMPVYNAKVVKLEKIKKISKKTDRADGGFGHTGIR